MIALVVAHAHDYVIGKNNAMPWHLPNDLQHFKRVTLGHPIVMGRKTFESIGRALPGRLNIVISRNASYEVPEGVVLVDSLEAGIARAQRESDTVMIIGGAQIYKEALPLADRLYVTKIDASFEGDARFPAYDEADYDIIEQSETFQNDEGVEYTFYTYERKKSQ
ncbi:dihydrofolate reductase [Savagea faecisuis]|uniref:Dihydrofolate reductase n=1 Tax=Savagea faecisuis TaxID=1274803 RepID=A0ABW3GZK4_9BACL|nr:Dihydrofolate reductase type 3 [uncultured bacterium]